MGVDRWWALEPNDDDLCDAMWGVKDDYEDEEESEEDEPTEEEKSRNQMKRSKADDERT